MQHLILDIETYTNYFLIAIKQVGKDKTLFFEMYNDIVTIQDFNPRALFSHKRTLITFNGNDYDLPVIAKYLQNATNLNLKRLSDEIILSKKPTWEICKAKGIFVPSLAHIDLKNVSPGMASLKIYGGRMNAPKMQDLPIDPGELISKEQAVELRKYCVNDLDTTELLYNTLAKPIDLRRKMSKQYDIDLMSKSDAQIAEAVIRHEYIQATGDWPKKRDNHSTEFKYKDAEIIEFYDTTLNEIYDNILDTTFKLGANGSPVLPEWLKQPIEVAGKRYKMGIGGLHSCEKTQLLKESDEFGYCDLDVASYYPNIILQQRMYPAAIGSHFLTIYDGILKRRLKAKADGNKTVNDTLKIVLNGTFGKLGSKYSILYAPQLLIQTTITGQFALLMLIERMEEQGIEIMSANTDGIVCKYRKSEANKMMDIAFDWEISTGFELERSDYKLLASRDVNNYVAVTTSDKVKGKGIFASTGLMKNPAHPVIYDAIKAHLLKGTDIEDYIRHCKDLTVFLKVRQVAGGAEWNGQRLGKAVRFYYSNQVSPEQIMTYCSEKKLGHKVPESDGARPCLDLPDEFPTDIDYDRYITMTHKVLKEIGYVREENRGSLGKKG